MSERARVSCVFGIVVQLRCFSVLFSTLLCFWSAVENIGSPEGGFTRSRAVVHACYNRTLARVAIRAYKCTQSSFGAARHTYLRLLARVHAHCVRSSRMRLSLTSLVLPRLKVCMLSSIMQLGLLRFLCWLVVDELVALLFFVVVRAAGALAEARVVYL